MTVGIGSYLKSFKSREDLIKELEEVFYTLCGYQCLVTLYEEVLNVRIEKDGRILSYSCKIGRKEMYYQKDAVLDRLFMPICTAFKNNDFHFMTK